MVIMSKRVQVVFPDWWRTPLAIVLFSGWAVLALWLYALISTSLSPAGPRVVWEMPFDRFVAIAQIMAAVVLTAAITDFLRAERKKSHGRRKAYVNELSRLPIIAAVISAGALDAAGWVLLATSLVNAISVESTFDVMAVVSAVIICFGITLIGSLPLAAILRHRASAWRNERRQLRKESIVIARVLRSQPRLHRTRGGIRIAFSGAALLLASVLFSILPLTLLSAVWRASARMIALGVCAGIASAAITIVIGVLSVGGALKAGQALTRSSALLMGFSGSAVGISFAYGGLAASGMSTFEALGSAICSVWATTLFTLIMRFEWGGKYRVRAVASPTGELVSFALRHRIKAIARRRTALKGKVVSLRAASSDARA